MAEREIGQWKKTLIEEVEVATKRILIELEEQHRAWELKSEEMEQMILSGNKVPLLISPSPNNHHDSMRFVPNSFLITGENILGSITDRTTSVLQSSFPDLSIKLITEISQLRPHYEILLSLISSSSKSLPLVSLQKCLKLGVRLVNSEIQTENIVLVSKIQRMCENKEFSRLLLSFIPPCPGVYSVDVFLGIHHVHGSPYNIVITKEDHQRETLDKIGLKNLNKDVGNIVSLKKNDEINSNTQMLDNNSQCNIFENIEVLKKHLENEMDNCCRNNGNNIESSTEADKASITLVKQGSSEGRERLREKLRIVEIDEINKSQDSSYDREMVVNMDKPVIKKTGVSEIQSDNQMEMEQELGENKHDETETNSGVIIASKESSVLRNNVKSSIVPRFQYNDNVKESFTGRLKQDMKVKLVENSKESGDLTHREETRIFKAGQICFALNCANSRWQQAEVCKVLDVKKDGFCCYRVRFLDTDREEVVTMNEIKWNGGQRKDISNDVLKLDGQGRRRIGTLDTKLQEREKIEKQTRDEYWKKVEEERKRETLRRRNNSQVQKAMLTKNGKHKFKITEIKQEKGLKVKAIKPECEAMRKEQLLIQRIEDLRWELSIASDLEDIVARGDSVDEKSMEIIANKGKIIEQLTECERTAGYRI